MTFNDHGVRLCFLYLYEKYDPAAVDLVLDTMFWEFMHSQAQLHLDLRHDFEEQEGIGSARERRIQYDTLYCAFVEKKLSGE